MILLYSQTSIIFVNTNKLKLINLKFMDWWPLMTGHSECFSKQLH